MIDPHPLSAFVRALARPDLDAVPDGELLRRFAAGHDDAAFAEVVRRHGPMVRGVARRVLSADADADDATQAAFVVLAQKAGGFTGRGTVGDYLHGVAVRVALKARSRAARRAVVERRAARPEATGGPPRDGGPGFDLDRVLAGLPAKYRAAVVLCDLEGAPRKVAAERLGVPEGTVSSRLTAAHKLLAARLTRAGFAPPAAGLVLTGSSLTAEAVELLTRAAVVAAGHAPGTVPAAVLVLALYGGRAMLWTKVVTGLTVAFVGVAVTAAGVGVAQSPGKPAADPPAKPAADPPAKPAADPPAKPAADPPARADPPAEKPTAPAAIPEPPVPQATLRLGLLRREIANLTTTWSLKTKRVNDKAVDQYVNSELVKINLYPAGPADVARFDLYVPKFGAEPEVVTLTGVVKVNPHRRPKEMILLHVEFTNLAVQGVQRDVLGDSLNAAVVKAYLPFIYELDGKTLRLARFEGSGEVDRPHGFKAADQPPGSPDLVVLEFEKDR